LGYLDAKRDWGYAPEYCEGMWRMLQQEKPEDFILATGENHTIREFCELAFNELDMEIEWQGKGIDEIGLNAKTGNKLIGIDKKYYRPTEVDHLLGDATKAKKELGWEAKMPFEELVKIMVQSDWNKVKKRGY
jgi:GDPmannose 4,6-dehydratase